MTHDSLLISSYSIREELISYWKISILCKYNVVVYIQSQDYDPLLAYTVKPISRVITLNSRIHAVETPHI